MDLPSVRPGPTGESGSLGLTSGAIRYATWLVPGFERLHEIKLDSGRLGWGPMHARYDGVVVATFPKPNRARPVVVAPMGVIGGFDLTIYAETRNNGIRVFADVFVNGLSLCTGEPMAALPGRATDATNASFETARVGCLSRSRVLIWMVPFLGVGNGIQDVHGQNAAAALAFALIGSCLITLAAYLMIDWALKRPDLTRNRGMAVAIAAYLIAGLGTVAAFLVGVVVAGAT